MRLGVAWVPGANAQYRAFQPMRAMARRGHEVIWPPDEQGEEDFVRLVTCDVVHIYRRYTAETLRVVAALARHGVPVTYDNDDDFTSVPEESPEYHQSGGLAGRRLFTAMVGVARQARVVTTTTEPLAAKYRSAGIQRVEVIPNSLIPDVPRTRRPHDGVVIGWIAAAEHLADAARIGIGDALRRILAKHPDVRVECLGVDLDLPERYSYDPWLAFEKLPGRIGGFDIGIAPLADISFNRARSDIKLKEYAASGVPWLASPVGPYVGLGEQQGGRPVPDDGWFDALDSLVTNPDERRRLGAAGQAWARGETIDAVADRWEQVFADSAGPERGPRVALGSGMTIRLGGQAVRPRQRSRRKS